jgi:hypothetical protein
MPNLAKLYLTWMITTSIKKRKKIAPFFPTPSPQIFLQKENK